jgi:hypothetical protein
LLKKEGEDNERHRERERERVREIEGESQGERESVCVSEWRHKERKSTREKSAML